MSDNNSNSGISVGLPGLVFLVFIILKLTGTGIVATWSWWWITAPLWGIIPVVVIALIVYVIYLIITGK